MTSGRTDLTGGETDGEGSREGYSPVLPDRDPGSGRTYLVTPSFPPSLPPFLIHPSLSSGLKGGDDDGVGGDPRSGYLKNTLREKGWTEKTG